MNIHMKALTIRPHWAWAIIFGGKDIENRTWPTNLRGPLAIHAGKSIKPHDYDAVRALCPDVPADPPAGVVLGVVDVLDVLDEPPVDNPWAHGPYCWKLTRPRPLREPLEWRGNQWLWGVQIPESLLSPLASGGTRIRGSATRAGRAGARPSVNAAPPEGDA